MITFLTLRRLSALVLVTPLVLASAPIPAHSSEKEVRPVPRGVVLNLGGLPLSQLTTTVPAAILTGWREQTRLGDSSVPRALATRPARQPATITSDPLWNGIFIGAAVGAGVGLKLAEIALVTGGPTNEAKKFRGVLLTTAIGAGIGALVDAIR